MADEKYNVFLSHNNQDKPAVEALAQRLTDHGLTPFLDKWHLIPGEPWQEALEEALDACQTVAVFLGPSGLGSWENEEMRSALEERVRDKSRRVIPVLLPGAPEPREKPLPRFLRRTTWVEFRESLDDEDAFHRLVAGIKGVPPGRPTPRAKTLSLDPPPVRNSLHSKFAVVFPITAGSQREPPPFATNSHNRNTTMLKSSKFWKTFFISYVTLIAGIWGFIEAYTYFQGDYLKQLLGSYWVLLYTLPLFVAFFLTFLAKHKKETDAESEAVPPPEQVDEAKPAKPLSVDISDNWLIGANVVRVLRDSVRVARNRLLGQSRIEVKTTEPPQAAQSPKKKAKKRKK